MKKAGYCICFLLVFLSMTQYSIPSALAQPALRSANGIYWTVTSEPGYVIYYYESPDRILSSKHFDIENVTDSISFGWRLMLNNPGFPGNIKFTINESEAIELRENNTNYEDVGPIALGSTDKPAFDITLKKGDKIWIRFPVSPQGPVEVVPLNQTPTIRSLSPDILSPQATDVTVVWSVDASDPDGDTILYKYFLNGVENGDWTENNTWSWNTSEGQIGSNTIEVRIRDGRHANEGYYDNMIQREFQVVMPAPESNITQEPPECVAEFDVDTCQEFRDALNNPTNCMKIINLRYINCSGPFLIKDNQNDLIIKSHPENWNKPILDGNGGDFVIAIEDSSNVSIDGLQIQNAGVVIYLEDVSDSSISNCNILQFRLDGISLNNTTGTDLQDNIIQSNICGNNETGINLTKCNGNCEISNNEIGLPPRTISNPTIDMLLENSKGNNITVSIPSDGYLIKQGDDHWGLNCSNARPCCKTSPTDHCDCNDYAFMSANNWTINCEDAG